MSNWLQKAEEAIALLQQGRAALASVTSAVKDGSAALSTTDQAKLNDLLAKETAESRAAHDSLEEAIRQAGG